MPCGVTESSPSGIDAHTKDCADSWLLSISVTHHPSCYHAFSQNCSILPGVMMRDGQNQLLGRGLVTPVQSKAAEGCQEWWRKCYGVQGEKGKVMARGDTHCNRMVIF